MNEVVKLNIGAGNTEIPGFTPIDRKVGKEAYPLDVADGSVDEIRASHVLEHFSHRQVAEVVKHWCQKLKPGGILRIAVPDFKKLAKQYLEGTPIPVQQFVMGSHSDSDDHHGAIFDAEALVELFVNCGLERVRRWDTEIQDCASYDVSLNVMGYKPTRPEKSVPGLYACMAAPRYGVVAHFQCYAKALWPLKIPTQILQGCFWWQHLTTAMENQLAQGAKYVLTLDFDTIFDSQDVLELYRLMEAYPEVDAICAVQAKRGAEHALFNLIGEDGKPKTKVYKAEFTTNLIRAATGHFGLTIFRGDSLRSQPKPWMCPRPNQDGRWEDGQRDADMTFWDNWLAAGKSLYLANKVVVGHIEEFITWPNEEFKPIYQPVKEWFDRGKPKGVIRCHDATE